MYDTVKKHLKSGLLTWSSDIAALAEWVLQYPGQVVLTVVSEFCYMSIVTGSRFGTVFDKSTLFSQDPNNVQQRCGESTVFQ